jgi:hypothetical protein
MNSPTRYRLIFNYGHWEYPHPLVQVQLDGVLIELTGMADPAPVVQTFIVDPEVGRRWQKDGEFMVGIWLNLTKCPLNIYIYTYIPNMGYDSDEMLKDDIIPLMVNDVWLISFIIIFCHI